MAASTATNYPATDYAALEGRTVTQAHASYCTETECYECGGLGYFDDEDREVCPDCRGTGLVRRLNKEN